MSNAVGWGSLQKPKPYRNVQYMLWIKQFRCIAQNTFEGKCQGPSEAAHTGQHGLSTKASDFRCLPICPNHHRGPLGLDSIGPEQFEIKYSVNLRELVLQHIEAWLAQGNHL